MELVWFCLLCFMFAVYLALDGFDLGAGIAHLWVARNEKERDQVLRSVGPVWDGNEVWLVAAGGTMFFAFPTLLSTALSGFYLPVMLVLWLLVFRALGIELRHQLHDRLWTQFWDVAFSLSSTLLAVFLGAAFGNVLRGVPLDEEGKFFEPLWTNFLVGEETGILDWYTLLAGFFVALTLLYHGLGWLSARTAGAVEERASRVAQRLVTPVLATFVLFVVATLSVQPNVLASFRDRPWIAIFPAAALLAFTGSVQFRRREMAGRAFVCSGFFVALLVATGATWIYPYVLPARIPELGLTANQAASASPGLVTALFWWIPGILLAISYFVWLYRSFSERVTVDEDSSGTEPGAARGNL